MRKTIENRIPVSIGIPYSLLIKIDNNAQEERKSRSDYIVHILKERLLKK